MTAGAPPAAKRLTAAIQGAPATVSTIASQTGGAVQGTDALEALANAGLTILDEKGNLHPQLAEATPTIENGLWTVFPDGRMETTWKIKQSAVWQDGAGVTSGDVAFTARVEQDKDLGRVRNANYDLIDRIETPDPYTVVVTWLRPYIAANAMFSTLVPKHLLEQTLDEDKGNFFDLPYWSAQFIGAGPYKVQDWVADSHVVFRANELFVLGPPKIDVIEVRFIQEPNTLMANLLAGDVQLTMGRSLSPEQAVSIRDRWQGGRVVSQASGTLIAFPQFLNPNPPIVTDARFRRALYYALDRKEMAETLGSGLAPQADTFLDPEEPEYRELETSIVRYEYDAAQASRILEDLGYTREGDGFFHDPSGQTLSLELRSTGAELTRKTTSSVAAYWQRSGIQVDLNLFPNAQFRDRQYVATFPAFTLFNQPSTIFFFTDNLHSRMARTPENGFGGGNNYARYMNPDFDTLVDRAFATIPWNDRMALFRQLMHKVTDELIVMPIFYSSQVTIISGQLRGVSPSKIWNAEQWDLVSTPGS